MDEKLKSEYMQKSSFLNGGGGEGEVIRVMTGWQAGVENGAMLTTYLFR